MYKKLLSTLILAMQLNTLASSLQASYLPSNLSSSYLPACIQENRVFILGGLATTLIVTNGYLLYRSCKTEQEHKREINKLVEKNLILTNTEQEHKREINKLVTEQKQINKLVEEFLASSLPELIKTVLYSAVEVTNPRAETYQKKQSIIRALKTAELQAKTEKDSLLKKLSTELISYVQDPAHTEEIEGGIARAVDIRNTANL